MEYTEKQFENLWSFIVEAMEFTDEENSVIEHVIPMTQELFDSIMDKCMEIGSDVEPLFFRLMKEYEEFSDVYADKIIEETKDVATPEWTEEEKEIQKEKLYARIRAEYGEDAI